MKETTRDERYEPLVRRPKHTFFPIGSLPEPIRIVFRTNVHHKLRVRENLPLRSHLPFRRVPSADRRSLPRCLAAVVTCLNERDASD